MDERAEGIAFPPLPVADPRVARARRASYSCRDAGDLRCAICGSPVVVERARRICLHCGFMTAVPWGIERA